MLTTTHSGNSQANEGTDAKNYPTSFNDAERSDVQAVVSWKEQAAKNRLFHERQWLINIAFLYGHHHFMIDKPATSGGDLQDRLMWEFSKVENDKKTRRTVNYILPLYRSLLARMVQFKSKVSAKPLTRTKRDIDAARVANEVLEDFWETVNSTNAVLSQQYCGMNQIQLKLYAYMLAMGDAWLKPYFNPAARAKVMLAGEIMEAQIGAVETEVIHSFDMFVDPMHRRIVQQKILSTEEIDHTYNQKCKPDSLTFSTVEKQLVHMLEGGKDETSYEGAKRVYEDWRLPTAENPGGRFALLTGEKYLIPPGPLPPEYRGRLGYFRFRYFDVAMSQQPQGVVEQLIPSQCDLNFTVSKIAGYKKWFNGKVMVPKMCKLETKYNDEIGQIIRYDGAYGKPEYQQGLNAPDMLYRDTERIRRDMEDIAATHDISMSKVPAGIKSGRAIENLSEIDNSQLSPTLIHTESQLSFFADTVLNIMQERYDIPRLLALTGKEYAAEVQTFKGPQLEGNRRIKIYLGSNLPTNTQARQEFIMALSEKGYVSRDKALELLEFSDVEGVFVNLDEQAEKVALQEIMSGNVMPPQPWDDHAVRIKIITQFLKSEEFKKLPPQMQQLFIERRSVYQNFLMAEQQTVRPSGAPQPGPENPGGNTTTTPGNGKS